ncbi:hypothetical protein [Streptomyces sp. NPDC051129]|uniref:hypothetical protein n=1 Tax=Streptomyces sp. NPDC051129 TaxID=3154639 RepID=UPI003428BF67
MRIRLESSAWPGDTHTAARVAAELADNAARHGAPFLDGSVVLRLTVLDDDALLVRVDDALPRFPGFEAVTASLRRRLSGLGLVRYYGGQITWHPLLDGERPASKAVQVVLPSGWETAA